MVHCTASRVPWSKFVCASKITLLEEMECQKVPNSDYEMGNLVQILPDSDFKKMVMWGTFTLRSGLASHLYMAGYWDVPFEGRGYETEIADDISLVYLDKDKLFRNGAYWTYMGQIATSCKAEAEGDVEGDDKGEGKEDQDRGIGTGMGRTKVAVGMKGITNVQSAT
ncbi:hypothetical protein FRC10_005471 [Ceratobasidium sp. 414]|nr:hypothetical protein FRC10_005471 [Ceratobasidium sp. 414]